MTVQSHSSVPLVAPTTTPREPLRLAWQPPTGMIGLSIGNFLLRIVTFGLHHFWGKTEVRRRIWSSMRINGEPLAYTGTGKELLFGFLIAFVVLFVPVTAISFVSAINASPTAFDIWDLVPIAIYVAMFALFGIAIYRAQRYRLSRTTWRGIRGALSGDARSYAWTYFWTGLLVPLTLGWIGPWRQTRLQSLIMNDTRFGDRPMRFSAPTGPLYGRYAVLWIGTLLIAAGTVAAIGFVLRQNIELAMQGLRLPPDASQIGAILLVLLLAGLLYSIASAWYRAGQFNHFARHTSFEGATFRGSMSSGGLIWLAISNFFILAAGGLAFALVVSIALGALAMTMPSLMQLGVTEEGSVAPISIVATAISSLMGVAIVLGFGIFTPVTQARSARYMVQSLTIEGEAPLAEIAQAAEQRMKTGEGLAQAFDVDAF